MSDGDALLAAIRENPDEDTPRLAFADWLDERGHSERAEFIRTQVEVARTPHEDDRRTVLEIRELQLIAANTAEWAAPRPAFPAYLPRNGSGDEREPFWSVFRRGFLEAVAFFQLKPADFEPGGEFERVFASHPIRELRLRSFQPGSLPALARRPELDRVENLDLTYFGREESDDLNGRMNEVEEFLKSPRLGRLRALNLTLFPTASGPPVRWLSLPVFSRLRRLNVWPRDDDRDGFWAAWANCECPELTDLRVPWGHERESPDVALRFVNSAAWKRLDRLEISFSTYGEVPFPWAEALAAGRFRHLEVSAGSGTDAPDLLAALASVPASGELRTLRLWGINANGSNPAGWLESGYAAGVTDLTLDYARLTDDDLERLAKSPAVSRLTRLSLSGYQGFTHRGLKLLFSSPHLGGLRDINLSDLTASAVLHLARRGTLRGLRGLSLGQLARRATTRNPLLSLAAGRPFPHLHTLKFHFGNDPAELRELLDSPNLPNLTALRTSFADNRLDAWKAFAAGSRLAWVGGHASSGDVGGGYVALRPENVYLQNHLDDFGW